jgi:hypothetical protein
MIAFISERINDDDRHPLDVPQLDEAILNLNKPVEELEVERESFGVGLPLEGNVGDEDNVEIIA